MRKLLIIIFSMHLFSAGAQQTQVYQNPEYNYNYGVELYQKQMYGPSIEQFKTYLELQKDGLKKMESSAYIEICHLKSGHENAEYALLELIELYPENALNNLIFYELGNFYFENNKTTTSSSYYSKVDLKGLPEQKVDEVNFRLGYSYYKRKKMDKAKNYLNLVRNKPGEYYVKANYYYGYICYTEKDFDCALRSFQKIKDENYESIPVLIAQMHYAKGEYKKAIDFSNEISNPKYSNVLNLIKGKSSFQLGDYKSAHAFFSKCDLRNLKPTDEERFEIGYTAYSEKHYNDANEQFIALSGLDSPLGQSANFYLGQSFLKLGKKQNAYNALAEAKRQDHNKELKEIAHFNHAKLAIELGYSNVALKSLQDYIDEYPDSENNDDAKGLLAELFMQTKNYRQACEILEGIKVYNAQSKLAHQTVHFHRAEELYLNRDFANAEIYFNKSLKFNSDKNTEGETWFWLGEIAYKNNSYTKAISDYNRFININTSGKSPFLSICYYNIGYCYFHEKNYPQALNFFKKYKEVSSYVASNSDRYLDNMLRLADCYFLTGQYDQSIESYGFVSSKKVALSDYAIFQQGILYGLVDKRDLKIATLRNIPQSYPSSTYIDDALYELGAEYLEDEKYATAKDFFLKLVKDHPYSKHISNAYLKLALLSYNTNNEADAIKYYKEVVTRFPKTKESEVALDALEIIYVQGGKGDEYLEMINQIPGASIRLSYQDSILFESAHNSYKEGNCTKALSGFRNYLDKFKDKAFFYLKAQYLSGECLYKDKKYDEAFPYYKVVAEGTYGEYTERSCLRSARIMYGKKDYSGALPFYELLNKYSTSKENLVESLAGLMRCNYQLNIFEQAKKYAVELLPQGGLPADLIVEINMNLGRISMTENNLRTAAFHFNNVLKINKAEPGAEAQYNKALIAYKDNKPDSCKNLVFKLNEKFPSYEYWVVKGFILLSDVYRDEKDYFQAKATLQSIIDNYDGKELLEIAKSNLKEIEALENAGKAEIKEEEEE
ncbi:MAG: tetratricopeptide repeat protein [Flavobacteriales bacterium]|nr:tetratricopeptide repeat protein [Flavobacteriales bacterium]